jgi:5-methylcytosine-specific restriction enzyme subunit McrC
VEQALPRHFTALEHDVLPVTSEGSATSLSTDEAEELVRLAEERPGFCERGYRSLRLAQYCGVVSLGTRTLEVLPKVGANSDAASARSVLLRLLRASAVHDGFRSSPAAQRLEYTPLLEIFISLFLESVTGRIVLSRQFGVHFNRPDMVACWYDDHTADNVWNRLVKAAMRRCRPWITRGELHRRWVELMAAFDDVADIIAAPGDLDRLVYDRQAARYKGAMEWVRWILTLLSPALRAGGERAPAFLFDMNAIFERVVANALRHRFAASHREIEVRTQENTRYLARFKMGSGATYRLSPDMVMRERGVVRIVADAKWKRLKVNRSGRPVPARSDMYQMHAYASAYKAERIALIYPAYAGIVTADTAYLLPASDGRRPMVWVVCIDVTRDDLPITGGAGALSLE